MADVPQDWRLPVPPEWTELAAEVGEQREREKETDNPRPFAGDQTNPRGILGEVIIGARLDLPPRLETLKGGDGGWDFEVNGIKLDAKAIAHPNPILKVSPADWESPSELWVAVWVSDAHDEYAMLGHATRWMIEQHGAIKQFAENYPKNRTLGWQQLVDRDWWAEVLVAA